MWNSKGVGRATGQAGARRKRIEEAVRWARQAHTRCAGDHDKAAVLDVLMRRIEDIEKGQP